MAYPGNPELSVQAQERVIAAFRQVISKLQEGQRQEALLGLEFVLRMDASFAPATNLHEQLSSGAEQIDLSKVIADLQAPTSSKINDLLVGAVEAFNNRDFVEAEEMVRKVLLELPGHQEARELLTQIEEALKVGGQAGQFLAQAREALDKNDPQEAANFVMMAQALDPHFAGIDSMLQEIQQAGEAAQQQPAAPPAEPEAAAEPAPGPAPPPAPTPPPEEPVEEAAYQTVAFDTASMPPEGEVFGGPDEDQPVSFDAPPEPAGAEEAPQEFAFEAADESAEAPQDFSFEADDEEEAPQDFAFDSAPADFDAPPEPPAAEAAGPPAEDFEFDAAPAAGDEDQGEQEFAFDAGEEDGDLFDVDPEPAEGDDAQAFEFDSFEEPPAEDAFDAGSSEEFAFGSDEVPDADMATPAPESEGLFDAPDPEAADLFAEGPEDAFGGDGGSPGVEALIQEGQDAFDAGAFDKAVEIWSRIYSIDPSNETAAGLIDQAREKQEETTRRVEVMLADAVDAESAGDIDKALELVNAILAINPESPEAVDMHRRLAPADATEALAAEDAPAPSMDSGAEDDLFADDPSLPAPDLGEELPDIDLEIPEPQAPAKKVVVKRGIPVKLIAVVGGALAVILAGAWLATLFLGSSDDDSIVEALNQALKQAEEFHQQGRTEEAIHLLEEYSASASDLDKKRIDKKIKKYKESQAPPTPTPIPDSLIEAEKFFNQGQFLSAYQLADAAIKKHPQDVGLAEIKERIIQFEPDVAPLASALKKADFDTAAKFCESMVRRHPDNEELQQAYLRSLFNSALNSMRTYNMTSAQNALETLIAENPNDGEAERILEFIDKYRSRPVDMQLKIFVGSISER